MDEEWSKLKPPKRIPGPYKILLHLAQGAIEQAKAELEHFRGNKIITKFAALELVEYAEANVKTGQTESRELLKVLVAFDLAVLKLSRDWSLELLKQRPTCQWAASIILASGVDESILREVHTILEPKNCSLARIIKAQHLMQTEEFTQAAALYGQLAQYQQDPTKYLLQQGTALENAGQFAEALKVYRRVWESSKNPIAANNAANMVSELAPQDTVQLTEAKKWIDEAVSTSPGIWIFRDTKGWISYLQGNQDEACEELRRVIKGVPNSLEFHYHLGAVEAAQGNSNLARWHLEAAIQLGQTRQNEGKTLTPAEVKALKRAGEALTKIEPGDREPTSENK
ncbi:MAG: tetratricopeptide repeat protein [Deltaproteobacteria bacterium]|nr:tetratricopeptide repeat protein [Deltaproteobacteria bacterium]